jgi:hypothetical protein
MDEFERMGGYALLGDCLATASGECQERMMASATRLIYVGDGDTEFDAELPFQHDGFLLPSPAAKDVFCNTQAMDVFRTLYLSGDRERQKSVLVHVMNIIDANPINYFLASAKSPIFTDLIQSFDNAPLEIKVMSINSDPNNGNYAQDLCWA